MEKVTLGTVVYINGLTKPVVNVFRYRRDVVGVIARRAPSVLGVMVASKHRTIPRISCQRLCLGMHE